MISINMLPVTVPLSLLPFAFATPKPQPAAHLIAHFTPPPKPSTIASRYPVALSGTGSASGYRAPANLSISAGANDCGSPSTDVTVSRSALWYRTDNTTPVCMPLMVAAGLAGSKAPSALSLLAGIVQITTARRRF